MLQNSLAYHDTSHCAAATRSLPLRLKNRVCLQAIDANKLHAAVLEHSAAGWWLWSGRRFPVAKAQQETPLVHVAPDHISSAQEQRKPRKKQIKTLGRTRLQPRPPLKRVEAQAADAVGTTTDITRLLLHLVAELDSTATVMAWPPTPCRVVVTSFAQLQPRLGLGTRKCQCIMQTDTGLVPQ